VINLKPKKILQNKCMAREKSLGDKKLDIKLPAYKKTYTA